MLKAAGAVLNVVAVLTVYGNTEIVERTLASKIEGQTADQAAMHDRVASLEAARLLAEHADGEADVTRANNVRQIEALIAEMKALDDRLQREMRDLNAAIIAEGRAVDERLQGEIGMVSDRMLQHIDYAESTFQRIEGTLGERAERIARLETLVETEPYSTLGD